MGRRSAALLAWVALACTAAAASAGAARIADVSPQDTPNTAHRRLGPTAAAPTEAPRVTYEPAIGAANSDSASAGSGDGEPDTNTPPGCFGRAELQGKTECDGECAGLGWAPHVHVCSGCTTDYRTRLTEANVGDMPFQMVMCPGTWGAATTVDDDDDVSPRAFRHRGRKGVFSDDDDVGPSAPTPMTMTMAGGGSLPTRGDDDDTSPSAFGTGAAHGGRRRGGHLAASLPRGEDDDIMGPSAPTPQGPASSWHLGAPTAPAPPDDDDDFHDPFAKRPSPTEPPSAGATISDDDMMGPSAPTPVPGLITAVGVHDPLGAGPSASRSTDDDDDFRDPFAKRGAGTKRGGGGGGPGEQPQHKSDDIDDDDMGPTTDEDSGLNAGLPKFVACFGDVVDRDPDMRYGPKLHGFNVTSCEAMCLQHLYLSLQDGGYCTCDDRVPSPRKRHPHELNYKCVAPGAHHDAGGSVAQYTGGKLTSAVFKVRVQKRRASTAAQLKLAPTPAPAMHKHPLNWMGCFKHPPKVPADMCCGPKNKGYTVESCEAACASWHGIRYKYFSLRAGGLCSCDNSYATPRTLHPRTMDIVCSMDGGAEELGGKEAEAVFKVST